jgi:KaiC/GvpD/RAD55 family RecA-like ATPase
VKSEKVNEAFLDSVKKAGKIPGICVLLTKPYATAQAALRKKGVNTGKLFFVDAVTDSEGENVVNIQPGNLTALSITINQALQSLPAGKKFLVFDSISNLAIQSGVAAVRKFALFLMERARKWGADVTIIVSKEGTDAELLAILKQGADKVVEK